MPAPRPPRLLLSAFHLQSLAPLTISESFYNHKQRVLIELLLHPLIMPVINPGEYNDNISYV